MNELHALLFLLAALLSLRLFDRYPDAVARPLVATAGTLALAYGGREVLRALGGGYYCCSHGYYATAGGALVLVGWVALLPALGVVEPPAALSGAAVPRDREGVNDPHDR